MKKEIIATIAFQDIGVGFYGIIDENGNQYFPINLPEKHRKEGQVVTLTIEEKPDIITDVMWGVPVLVAD